MRAAGRPGRGERARVAARVRELLDGEPAAARTPLVPDGADGLDVGPDARADPGAPPGLTGAWFPGADFDRHVPSHATAPGRAPDAGGRPARRGAPADVPIPGSTGRSAGGLRADLAALIDRLRWDPGRRAAMALGVLVVVVVAGTGWWLAASRPHTLAVGASASLPVGGSMLPATGSPSPLPSGVSSSPPGLTASAPAAVPTGAPPSASSAPTIVVDVAGRVRRPGIYELPSGARVFDAVRAAGGARRGVSTLSLNLAAPLADGEQIVVGLPGGAVPTAPTGGSIGMPDGGSSSPAAVIDLNSATLEQLESLPGVGPVLGQNILDYRDAHGRFASVSELAEVSGIGDVRLAQLSPLVSV